ncbi:MAG: GNAT family N-acetyltransferase [Deltaproteobacteria bacterium]|nr:GNAT family N-acetyltransferase [Deltaproteobacteria bacterium]
MSAVRIRPYSLGDAEALCDAVLESRAQLSQWMDWAHPAYSIADSRPWVEASVEKFAAGTELNFVIESDAGRFLGGCGLNDFTPGGPRANLGYWVRSSATRGGVASAAARRLAAWAWESTNLVRLEVLVAVGNLASLRVAEKIGAQREGVLRKRVAAHGTLHDAVMHSLIRPAC